MTPLVPLTMFAWIPAVLGLFWMMEARRAVITAFLAAWLFLPMVSYSLPGLPDYTKMTATCWGILIAAAVFDNQRLLSIKIRAVDIPLIIMCLSPLASSLSNDLGMYDGLSAVLFKTVIWGFPYFIGRVYFSDLDGVRALAIGFFIGGLVYIPFCFFENIMSPQLHRIFYGFHQHDFSQTFRYGGWRPMVFMEHGLMVAMWMAAASLVGLWLWQNRVIEKIMGIPVKLLVPLLLIQTVLCRSTGAVGLLIIGSGVLFLTRRLKKPLFVICLIAIPLLYVSTRATGYWSGQNIVNFIAENFSVERADSLSTRLENENVLAEKARQRAVFGWGGWGRARVYDEEGKDITITDGLWIIVFGNYGLVGLLGLTCAILMPILVLMRYYPVRYWDHPRVAPAACLAVMLVLYMIDNLLNAMVNPMFMLVAGGITGLTREPLESSVRPTEEHQVWQPDQVPKTRFLCL